MGGNTVSLVNVMGPSVEKRAPRGARVGWVSWGWMDRMGGHAVVWWGRSKGQGRDKRRAVSSGFFYLSVD